MSKPSVELVVGGWATGATGDRMGDCVSDRERIDSSPSD
jgi:hypothetical protein